MNITPKTFDEPTASRVILTIIPTVTTIPTTTIMVRGTITDRFMP